eukprot:TRINITY_DN43769_c0_g1_i1.p1 TRINITY_DN43769_c0_g1~~TRINITY_DN43769_c0_g1_i1.p1  ORF type:complete len:525 (-),score=64.95 TRINITY_DN43769_c0_g1_i1:185-1657(-)
MKSKRVGGLHANVIKKLASKNNSTQRKSKPVVGCPTVGGVRLAGKACSAPFEKLRPGIRRLVERGRWPGVAACVFVNGELRLLEEAGFADIEAQQPMTSKSMVRLYSMTKTFVAACVLQLVDDRKLGLDDKLSDHIPAFANMLVMEEGDDGMPIPSKLEPADKPITIRHLLTHTSGIAGHYSRDIDGPKKRNAREMAWANLYSDIVQKVESGEIRSLGQWADEIARIPLWSHPGCHYCYGYGYDLLGFLVELKSGKRLAAYMRERIFKPLGMHDTRWDLGGSGPKSPSARKLSVLYRCTKSRKYGSDGRQLRLVRLDPSRPGGPSRWTAPCALPSGGGSLKHLEGGLLSTLDDCARFMLAISSGGAHPATGRRILSPCMAAEMMADQTQKLSPPAPATASPYHNLGIGLACLGELLREKPPSDKTWFDGVPGVLQWGGAGSTAVKLDPNGGQPILALLMTQAFPQDDGITVTNLLRQARRAIAAEKAFST